MSKLLPVSQTLEILESLRNAARDFTTRAAKLNDDFRLRTHRANHRRDASLEEMAKNLETALGHEETAYQSAMESLKANFEKRKARLSKAYRTSKELGLTRVEERTGQRKYALQKQMLQAERDRERGLADAATELQEFRNSLAAEQQALALLERDCVNMFKGFRGFLRRLTKGQQLPQTQAAMDHTQALNQLREEMAQANSGLKRFRRFFVLRVFRHPILWLILIAIAAVAIQGLPRFGIHTVDLPLQTLGIIAGGLFILILLLRFVSQTRAKPVAEAIAGSIARARILETVCAEKSDIHYQQEIVRLDTEFKDTTVRVDQDLKQALSDATGHRARSRTETDEKTFRITALHEQLHRQRVERLERQHSETVTRLQTDGETSRQSVLDSSETSAKKFEAEHQAQYQGIEAEWTSRTSPLFAALEAARTEGARLFPPWDMVKADQWKPPAHFEHTAKFGDLNLNLTKLAETPAGAPVPPNPAGALLSAPMSLVYPSEGSIIFETGNTGRDQVIGSLNNIILRLLSVAPPGRLNFTIIDPVGLGQNFAGVMHLADYEEQLINNRIWTQSTQIEQRLLDLNEHMEKVIQMYLRNEYATIAEYNEQAGVIAEKYQFLVVADFPVNFSDVAARRLLSIASSGARCGVYLLLHWDTRQPLPQDFVPDELRKAAVRIACRGNDLLLEGRVEQGADLALEAPPPPEQAIAFIQTVGQSSRDSGRVEVPFSQVTPAPEAIWSEETTSELRVPIGRTGATKLQYLEFGKGTRQHGLIAGKTGSGKSTLFHVIITNLALWCSPEQVEFYLVDFKKGVEFKCYAAQRLPHARVVAIESDREFGLSVLQKLDDELKRRGDLFRKLGVQDLPGYKRAGGEALPRCLLLIDEFQEFFVEDDKIAQTASMLLDRIVRQGRAFGIHVLLGSQTLGGAYTVARTTLGQMVVRVALQCNEADAYLIMDDNNPAPRLLSRPGEGIYNDTAGTIEGNSPFQVVWLPEPERDAALERIRQRADQNGATYRGPFVFEGNAPAEVRENEPLQKLIETPLTQAPPAVRLWLGAPNSIKGPTEAAFYRQSGSNMLLIGQREEALLAILAVSLVSLAVQHPPGSVRLAVCDASPPGTPAREFLERVTSLLPHQVSLTKPGDVLELLKALAEELKQRGEAEGGSEAPSIFVFINGLQRFNKLRYEEDFGFSSGGDAAPNPSALLTTLITDGPRLGLHVIASCDTYNNVNRFLSRKMLSEFEMRVLFQMSANDSASLIDNPKASILGLHRALFYNEHEGYLETFRPYALPAMDWFEEAARKLESKSTTVT